MAAAEVPPRVVVAPVRKVTGRKYEHKRVAQLFAFERHVVSMYLQVTD